jgi:AcrR family transcriptional regulator
MSVRSGMADCAVAPGARCLRIAPPESLDVTKLAHALVTLARPRRRMPVTASMALRSRGHRDGLPARTRRRIPGAATDLFSELGYVATIMEAIAARADVAVETIYSRFRTKANLLDAILGPAITGSNDGLTLFDRPEIAEIRARPASVTRSGSWPTSRGPSCNAPTRSIASCRRRLRPTRMQPTFSAPTVNSATEDSPPTSTCCSRTDHSETA